MTFKVTRAYVLAAELEDEPGGLVLRLKALADSGANLDCIVARRRPDKKGGGVVYVSTTNIKRLYKDAGEAGFVETPSAPTLKIEGPDRPGLGAELAKVIGDAKVSMNGLTATTTGHRFTCFIGFDTESDLESAKVALETRFVQHSRWHQALADKLRPSHKAQ